jgi:hypothetical protein
MMSSPAYATEERNVERLHNMIMNDTRLKLFSWFPAALKPAGVGCNVSEKTLQEGEQVFRMYQHPDISDTIVILTKDDARQDPPPGDERGFIYLRDASERGQDVSIKDGDSLIGYIQGLNHHLGITGDIPDWITQQITTYFSQFNT